MGNYISTKKEPVDFQNIIDTIATYYILTMDFKNLSKLSEKEHCDKMLVLTSDIIGKYFTLQQIAFLEKRIENGEETNDMKKEKVIYMSKEELEKLDIDVNKKERVCLGIAKFYIIIAHVFAAIVMTINPMYAYVDESGVKHEYNIYEKDKIPANAATTIQRLNICKNRINTLQSGQETMVNEMNGNMDVAPNICSVNLLPDGNVKSLNDEPGIPELKQLYLDEDYDFSTGKFKGMTDETKKQYRSDLKEFYKVFTGKDELPDDVKDFSDIKLKNYENDERCINNKFKSSYKGNINKTVFSEYAKNIKDMIQHANDKQAELLKVINMLFTYVLDPRTGNKTIKINPALNDAKLSSVVKDTRKIIIELYSKCEKDYLKGVSLYEKIVDTIGASTLMTQNDNLNQALKTVSDPLVPPFIAPAYDADVEVDVDADKEVLSPPPLVFTPSFTAETPPPISPPINENPFANPQPEVAFNPEPQPVMPAFNPEPQPVMPAFNPEPQPVMPAFNPEAEPNPESQFNSLTSPVTPTFESEAQPEVAFNPEAQPEVAFNPEAQPVMPPINENPFANPQPEVAFNPEAEPNPESQFNSLTSPVTPTFESQPQPQPEVPPVMPAFNHEAQPEVPPNPEAQFNSFSSLTTPTFETKDANEFNPVNDGDDDALKNDNQFNPENEFMDDDLKAANPENEFKEENQATDDELKAAANPLTNENEVTKEPENQFMPYPVQIKSNEQNLENKQSFLPPAPAPAQGGKKKRTRRRKRKQSKKRKTKKH